MLCLSQEITYFEEGNEIYQSRNIYLFDENGDACWWSQTGRTHLRSSDHYVNMWFLVVNVLSL